jgi:16S rRNA C967 or C1407 C5-methylase (RsmB/RsmF family)
LVQESILFDRILCDVPCSGDGTIRKALDIWRRWTPGNGNGLHPLQLRIALHACQMLKVGGRLVYSTCTFNPVEDEAVVAEVPLLYHASAMHSTQQCTAWLDSSF